MTTNNWDIFVSAIKIENTNIGYYSTLSKFKYFCGVDDYCDFRKTGPEKIKISLWNPGFDGSDVVVKSVQGIIKVIWNDGNEYIFDEKDIDNSHTLAENLKLQCDDKIFPAIPGEEED